MRRLGFAVVLSVSFVVTRLAGEARSAKAEDTQILDPVRRCPQGESVWMRQ
jgi:hypothetical protein